LEEENMDKFEEYEARVNEIESRYADCAFKSVNVKFLDGTTFNEHYSRIFRSKDIFTQQRNRYRTPFQLERDRILSSSLFQRLSGKTQLLTSTYEKRILMENRLTHTLKVMQIARSICRGLKLNEDLVEVIALGHDIGHPPFAHIGEKALEEWIKEKFTSKQKSLSESDIPILNNIRSEYRDKVKEYFTFGNDPKEKFFMHGRQGFRLLVLKRKVEKRDYLRFMRPVMYGIWRHSVKNFDTDNVFRFTKNMGEKNIKLSGKED
jgi:dGTP triphosphohydrolase